MIDRRTLLLTVGSVIASAQIASSQERYPQRPIRLIVPRAGNGVVDVIAREWSEKVRDTLGPSFVDNIGGGGGRLGAMAAARAPADGHTLFLGSTSELVINPILASVSYDPVKDFVPISILSVATELIAINPMVPARDLKELVAYAKHNPGKVSYGSAGPGSPSHLAGELFKQLAGTPDIVHVPYKGGPAAVGDTISGQLTFSTPAMSATVLDLHRTGKIRILAVTSEKRLQAAPDLPTGIEQGFPGLVTELFIGLFAPTGTPQVILDQLYRVTSEAMLNKNLREKLVNAGFEIVGSDPAYAVKYVQDEINRWAPILKVANVQP